MTAITWWQGTLAAALAQAAAQQQPLFLYWGAQWCPPCNRVKSEIFAHSAVQTLSRQMLCYQLDGDSHGAQALAAQLRLRSYPTLVLFAPDGSEITRLPCELDGERFAAALAQALAAHAAGSSAAQAMQAALSAGRALSVAEWNLLADYSWDTDEGALLGERALAPTLLALLGSGVAEVAAAAAMRLRLHALLAQASSPEQGADLLLAVCADEAVARANMDILNNYGIELIKLCARRETVAAALRDRAALWAQDFWLAAPDKLAAARLQLRMARLLAPSAGLQEVAREQVAAALDAASDGYQLHTLVNTAVSLLNEAGLGADAEYLLQSHLPNSHTPFYFMLSLAGSARRRGDTAAALDWYQHAYETAVGAATRIQWGVTYLSQLMEQASADGARIAQARQALLADLATAGADAQYQRNHAQLQKLARWPQLGF
ncbi:thioredoxin family protein [Duganella qianjiadongensis]|uniref:Thiol reductase thioredoxin n=1 Tax=Duganella qianjiadongensis TaxID=2692176 RepID=A0ABW9VP51_9BURK|nr:thioredoxin family protein [Duganella qianjiadongensis]MYM41208.1 thiol reductase thioredoxin [Duganella qianjiadongensis]